MTYLVYARDRLPACYWIVYIIGQKIEVRGAEVGISNDDSGFRNQNVFKFCCSGLRYVVSADP